MLTRRAIESAKSAWGDWRRKPAKNRSALLRKWYELMLANLEDLGKLMTAEQGKPLAEAKGEVAYAASFIEWFAEEAKCVYGDTIPSPLGWPVPRVKTLGSGRVMLNTYLVDGNH